MKKGLLFLIMLLLIPILVNAEEYCTIISGNGKNVGDEIACGGERFYVVENDGTNIKMLAKYNLYVGIKYERSTETYTVSSINNLTEMRNNCKTKMGENALYTMLTTTEPITYTCYIKSDLKYSEVKQSKDALGAHGGSKGNPDPIEIGVVQLIINNLVADTSAEADDDYNNYTFADGKLEYLTEYEKYLKTKGIEIIDSHLITIKEIDDIVYKTSNKRLPLKEWADSDWEPIVLPHGGHDNPTNINYYKVGSIKDNIKSGYEWLWGTTYWTGTLNNNNGDVYFIDTLGNLCADYPCPSAVGAGIRPVVIIASNKVLMETSVYETPTKKELKPQEPSKESNPDSGAYISYVAIVIIFAIGIIAMFIFKHFNKRIKI